VPNLDKTMNKKKIIIWTLGILLLAFLTRGLFFEKEMSCAIANETYDIIQDFEVRVDNKVVFKDSIWGASIPCCGFKEKLDFGFHKIIITSESKKISKEFRILAFNNFHTYIGIWENKETGEMSIKTKKYYFYRPMYL